MATIDDEGSPDSDAGIELIVSFESVRLTAYQDPVGIWTIGAGHTGPDVHKGSRSANSAPWSFFARTSRARRRRFGGS
jgi:GH24 family phage-related lysozyme (muramidase)